MSYMATSSGTKFQSNDDSADGDQETQPLVSAGNKEMDIEQSVINNIKNLTRNMAAPATSDCCIYRVPEEVRDLNAAAYTPKIVSFGPFHHGKPKYAAMEDVKKRLLWQFIQQLNTSLEELVRCAKSWEPRARRCYSESIKLNDAEFVQMLLMDGIFIFEYMISRGDLDFHWDTAEVDRAAVTGSAKKWEQYAIDDDLLLLENQLPFFVIQGLHTLAKTKVQTLPSLDEIITAGFLCNFMVDESVQLTDIKHLLDALHTAKKPEGGQTEDKFKLSKCATNLHAAGIKFKSSEEPNHLSFNFNAREGVLEIPYITFSEQTELLYRNLMAYELLHYDLSSGHITEYIFFMDCLINTSEDVYLLEKHGVIQNLSGDGKVVSSVFNNLCTNMVLQDESYHLGNLAKELEEYYNNRKHKWMATLKRDYLSTPWKVASITAAVILLLLTLMQTVLAFIAMRK